MLSPQLSCFTDFVSVLGAVYEPVIGKLHVLINTFIERC